MNQKTEEEMMKLFCKEQLDIDVETLRPRHREIIRNSFSYQNYKLARRTAELGKTVKGISINKASDCLQFALDKMKARQDGQ